MSASIFFLLSYAVLAGSMYQRFGLYTPLAFFLGIVSFLCLLLGVVREARGEHAGGLKLERWAAFILVVFLVMGAYKLPLMYLQWEKYAVLYFYMGILLIPLVGYFYFFRQRAGIRPWIFTVVLVVAFALRLGVPFASPAPAIDVFVMIRESVQNLLQGLNPYVTPFSAAIGQMKFQLWNIGYPYPPASLYPFVLFSFLSDDPRMLYILCEAVTAYALWRIACRRNTYLMTELLILLFLYHPRALFNLEQSWIEPLVLAVLALSLMFKDAGKDLPAALLYGYFLSLKQYLVFFLLHWFLLERKVRRIVLGIAVSFTTFLPFLFWDVLGLWKALAVHLTPSILFRLHSLSLSSFLYRQFGSEISVSFGGWVGVAMSFLTFTLFFRRPGLKNFLASATMTTFAMFLFGGQAFHNYYYFVSGMLLLLVALQGKQEMSEMERVMYSQETSFP